MSAPTNSTAMFIKEKEDVATSTQQSTNPLSIITVKETGLPCFICTTSSEEEVLLVAALTSQISSQIASSISQSLTKPSTPPLSSYSLNFLSSEQVDLEIQIQDLLSDLSLQESSKDSSKEINNEDNSPFALFSSHAPKSNRFSKPQEFSKANTKQTHSEAEQSKTESILNATVTSAKHSKSPVHQTNSRSVTQTLQNKPQELHSKASLSIVQTESERIRESMLTTKTLEQRNAKQNKDRQQQSHQESQQDSDQKKHQQRNAKTTPSSKEPKSSLSIADLQYFSYSQANQSFFVPKQMEKSAVFQKKSLSPIAIFTQTQTTSKPEPVAPPNTENIFVRFMHLMARILGQAEAEAHELYLKVKARTDDVDTLTLLLSKINNESDAVNWEEQEDLKRLVDRAKELGVPIHDSYQWSTEEKKLLKENIIMRKENLEKITQLERTDMQRLLQEVSQCHQARSNVLKLLKELMDTFIYNLRP